MPSDNSSYQPPWTLSDKAVTLIVEIASAMERFKIVLEGTDGIRLRKINHLRTVRGTTAIEGNTLSEAQVTAILSGKRVIAPAREIKEILGAHSAYSLLHNVNPYSEKDILHIHKVMMADLVTSAGSFRTRSVGVIDGNGKVLHIAPPANRVPQLMGDLLDWTKNTLVHPLVKSCIFHYEFEFIHPFNDGNGRMGRFLQTAILGKWNQVFCDLPIENIIYANQEKYYAAINHSTANADCGVFIDFMLATILETLQFKEIQINVQITPNNVPINVPIKDAVLKLVSERPGINRIRMAQILNVDVKSIGRVLVLLPQIEHRGSKRTGGYFLKGK